ncbi:hypothetical protein B7P43_G10127 [Cryptotermes secundus]|uniref:DUF4371 domain-containing protein n=1 Tax=Cryptotermes secundus TaxID=105785 RepID=A0A2J7RAE0_9NEOP|nr:hypothetical protein B7P43_G10127 [Cryptotermes secundus]
MKGKLSTHRTKKSAFTRKYMDRFLKFGFKQCPDTDNCESKLFALQLDESTDIQSSSLLLTYARYVDHDKSDMKKAILSVSFEKCYPGHEDPWRQGMWIVNPFVEHNETDLSHEETF